MLVRRGLAVATELLGGREAGAVVSFVHRGRQHDSFFKRHVFRLRVPTRHASSSSTKTGDGDHRALATRLGIYTTHETSRGSPLFLPDGAHILVKLQEFLRAQYAIFGFEEVVTPVIYKQSLWEQSGHWDNYGSDMYEVVGRGASGHTEGKERGEEEKFGLKPMNCPGHCLLYGAKPRMASHLPVRFADFSPLHRNEISGALTGLTRLRRFHQDDGHIFCREDQVGAEIRKTLQLVHRVYSAFGLRSYSLVLSTRPEDKYIGNVETWDRAEAQLRDALNASGVQWQLNPHDGAFYGPKIDVIVQDRNAKHHQTATIQLDFQLPERFQLQYAEAASTQINDPSPSHKQPVLIHRAVLGSLERFLALLLEHTQGHLPLWLSPRQVRVLTVLSSAEATAYAQRAAAELRGFETVSDDAAAAPDLQPLAKERVCVDLDVRAETFSKKIRDARRDNCRILVTVGPDDVAAHTVTANFKALTNLAPVATALEELRVPVPLGNDQEPRWDRVRLTPTQLRTLILKLTSLYL